jgi:hypothetical protein
MLSSTLRYQTTEVENGLKLVFHFNRIAPKRNVFLCFLTTRVEQMTSTQKKMLRYVTIRLEWKTSFKNEVEQIINVSRDKGGANKDIFNKKFLNRK